MGLTITSDRRDKFRKFAAEGILASYGIETEKANDFSNFSLHEIARQACLVANQNTSGGSNEIVGRALSSTDFPKILSNVGNKVLLDAYTAASETWQIWCEKGVVKDFKLNTLISASETDGLEQIKELEPYKYGEISEKAETFSMATYGKIWSFSRQSIVNDDTGALISAMKARGEAAARKVGDLAYSVLTANAAMADGVALFHANHSNLGVAAVVGETAIGLGVKALGLQKDLQNERRLNIRPRFFIAPVSLEASAEQYFSSLQFSDSNAASTRTNMYGGSYFQRVYDARLDDSSATAWYLAGGKGKTVKVFFLSGQEKPTLEQMDGWLSDGIEFKVRLDVAAKAVDWRAVYKNPGA